jgi:hypothetical protein
MGTGTEAEYKTKGAPNRGTYVSMLHNTRTLHQRHKNWLESKYKIWVRE